MGNVRLDYFSTMAARSDSAPAGWRRPFLAWLDGIEEGWAIPVLIVGFAGIWMIFLMIAYLSGDLHADPLEAWSVGRRFEWGNAKHPPLMGWVAHLWTRVFPLTDWSFQLLAMTNAAIALWAIDLIARRFVRGDKRAVVLLLLMLLPAYQFHAQRFNANTVLLAIWPLATFCFLRSFETRAVGWAALAGALAAVAMLGKYYSAFLVGSFGLAAICHPQRRLYFGSPAPWVSTLVGLIVLGPHIHWLATTGATPFEYAMAHGGVAIPRSILEAVKFLLGLVATLALPALAWMLIAETRLARFAVDFKALNSSLWLLFLVCVFSIILPVIATVAIGTDMPSLWALQGLFLFAVLVVCGASFAIERFYTVNLAVLVIGIALVAVTVAAPIHAAFRNAYRFNNRAFYRLAALELTRQWHELSSDEPLTAISGDDALAFATAFYSPDHPFYKRPFQYQYMWGMPRLTTLEQGWAAMCFAEDDLCLAWMDKVAAIAPNAIRREFIAKPRLWGRPGVTARITSLMVLPEPSRSPTPPSSGAEDLSAIRRGGAATR
jgi:Dolichyl-phosphate-mannose-protein mannosyltransferase